MHTLFLNDKYVSIYIMDKVCRLHLVSLEKKSNQCNEMRNVEILRFRIDLYFLNIFN
jgi:hypothetical protein